MTSALSWKRIFAGLSVGLLILSGFRVASAGSWATKAAMSLARYDSFVGAIDSVLYVAGGGSSSGDTPTLQAYNPATDTWGTLASMPGGRYQGASGVINGKLYVVGGWTTSPGLPNSSLFIYDPVTNTWSSGAPIPTLSGCGGGGVIDGKLYVVTPCDGNSGYRSFFHVYDPGNNTWTRLADSPRAHANGGYGAIDGKFYAAGGIADSGNHSFVDEYNPANNTWTTRASMPTPRYAAASVILQNRLYLIGGYDGTNYLSSVLIYDPASDAWTTETAMPTARTGSGAAVLDGKIYVAGGSNLSGLLTANEVFTETPKAVVLTAGKAFGVSGGIASVPITLTNPNTTPIAGVQFTLVADQATTVQFDSFVDSVSALGFESEVNAIGDSTLVLIHSPSGASIPPGTRTLGYLRYAIDADVVTDTIGLHFSNLVVGDTLGVEYPDSSISGAIYATKSGDVSHDGKLNVLDVIRLVRVIIGREATPTQGSFGFFVADANGDGTLNVQDVVWMVNTILNLSAKALTDGPSRPVVVALGAIEASTDGQAVVPLTVDANGVVAALQLSLSFDPARLTVGAPLLTDRSAGLSMDYGIQDGVLRIVVYSLSGRGIAPGNGAILLLPTMGSTAGRDGVLTLTEALPVTRQGALAPVIVESSPTKSTAVPTAFALDAARPNPFNPTTSIEYAVSKQTQVTLIVYNLLGQAVARLSDGVRPPGRYTVVWNGRNTEGAPVASGVYLYQITTTDGFTQTRKMTLLK